MLNAHSRQNMNLVHFIVDHRDMICFCVQYLMLRNCDFLTVLPNYLPCCRHIMYCIAGKVGGKKIWRIVPK